MRSRTPNSALKLSGRPRRGAFALAALRAQPPAAQYNNHISYGRLARSLTHLR